MNLQDRIEKREQLKERAEKLRRLAMGEYGASCKIVEMIPMGQPILVGHHSERGHRRALARSEAHMRKNIELTERAEALESRSDNTAIPIFSGDDDAIDRLKEKLAQAEAEHARLKEISTSARKGGAAALEKMNLTDSERKKFLPNGKASFFSFYLPNSGARVRDIKKRIAWTKTKKARETIETEINGIKIEENWEEDRLRLYFPGKPSPEKIDWLKRCGYRWTPSLKCWQCYISQYKIIDAKKWLAA